jgi:hypothetical protein
MSTNTSIQLLTNPWHTQFSELLSLAKRDLLLACPYITRRTTRRIVDDLEKAGTIQDLQITFLTNVRPDSNLSGSLELDGLAELGQKSARFYLFHVPSLDAKVYVADTRRAVVTSANLTDGGLSGNCEYGVALNDPTDVGEVRRDLESYSRLGALISVEEASALHDEISQLQKAYRSMERKMLKEAGKALRTRLRAAEEKVLRFRARGKSTHAILSDTIEYLLSRGPLRTIELHPLIKAIHPDICDDSIDRVIDGVNFGKKWKHYVRNAQQFLKRTGRIHFDSERWHLSAPPSAP